MNRVLLLPKRGDICLAPAVIVTLVAFGSTVWAGFYSPTDDLLELIKQGEVQKIDEPEPEKEIPELVMVEFSPPPPPELNPEFVKPVEAAPSPTPEAAPPTPTPTPVPEPTPPPEPEPTPPPEPIPTPPPKPKPKLTTKAVKPQPAAKPKPAIAPRPNSQASYAASTPIVGNRDFPRPPYPLDAKRRRAQGTVDLSITVSNGSIVNVEVVGSSGYAVLDSSTRSWIKSRWHFPAGVTRTLRQSIAFDLR